MVKLSRYYSLRRSDYDYYLCDFDHTSYRHKYNHDAEHYKRKRILDSIHDWRKNPSRRCSEVLMPADKICDWRRVLVIERNKCPAGCVRQKISVTEIPERFHVRIKIRPIGRGRDETTASAAASDNLLPCRNCRDKLNIKTYYVRSGTRRFSNV